MEAIKNITQQFKPNKIINENENLKNLWDVPAAEATNQYSTDPVILTPEIIEQYMNRDLEIPELTAAIESLTEYYILDYFHYNDYLLVDEEIQVYLISYYSYDNIQDNYRLELNPDYNPLYNDLPADSSYYFNIEKYNYNPYYPDIGDEALNLLTWTILENNATGNNWKTEITTKDITAAITEQDQEHQKIIRTANYQELTQDIKTTYNKIIKNYLTQAQEALSNKFYEEIYKEAYNTAKQETINQYTNQPIRGIT